MAMLRNATDEAVDRRNRELDEENEAERLRLLKLAEFEEAERLRKIKAAQQETDKLKMER